MVDFENGSAPENIIYQVTQQVNPLNRKKKGITPPHKYNNLWHTYVDYKNYSHEEVMEMIKLENFYFMFYRLHKRVIYPQKI